MSQPNPIEAAHGHVTAEHAPPQKRPRIVTVSLVLLWSLVAARALGSIAEIATIPRPFDSWSASYIAYLAVMTFVPTFLLVSISRASSWARVALLVLYALNTLFRVFLFVNDGVFTASRAAWLFVPVTVDFVALTLLFLPTSNRWFGVRPNKPHERTGRG
jgi:hypothetical protein